MNSSVVSSSAVIVESVSYLYIDIHGARYVPCTCILASKWMNEGYDGFPIYRNMGALNDDFSDFFE